MAKTLFATFIFFLRKIRIRFFEKVASRATKMLERALISQGKVKSALVARETCFHKIQWRTKETGHVGGGERLVRGRGVPRLRQQREDVEVRRRVRRGQLPGAEEGGERARGVPGAKPQRPEALVRARRDAGQRHRGAVARLRVF